MPFGIARICNAAMARKARLHVLPSVKQTTSQANTPGTTPFDMEPVLTDRKPQSVTVREAVLSLLRSFGMTRIFGNPGSTELPLFLNFPSDFIYVLGLQEAEHVAEVAWKVQEQRQLGRTRVAEDARHAEAAQQRQHGLAHGDALWLVIGQHG